MALQSMAHSFTELDKAVVHVISLISLCTYNHRYRSKQKKHKKYYMQIYANTFENLKKKKMDWFPIKKEMLRIDP